MTTAEIGYDINNRISSTIEQVMWLNNVPRKYFAYVDETAQTLTTWTGAVLGNIQFGRQYKSPGFGGFASTRQSIRVKATNGAWYSGTYYKSSGNYARITLTTRKGW